MLTAAQSKAPAAAAHQPSPKAKAPAAKGATSQQDKAIEAAIRTKLAKSRIRKDGFTVRVQGGVAYWDGTTNVIQHKGSATRMAKTAGGRKSSAANLEPSGSAAISCTHLCYTDHGI